MDSQNLVQRIVSGDQSAFKNLVEIHQDRTYSICLSYLKNEEEAEDTAQEVFLEVFRSIHLFNAEAELSTWIYKIAINKSLELIRKHKAQKRFGFLTSIFGQEDTVGRKHADFVHPGIKLENKERASILFTQIESLPKNQRTAFQLKQVEGFSYQEIAAIMETSVSSVESLMHRAKKNLQQRLRRYYETEYKS